MEALVLVTQVRLPVGGSSQVASLKLSFYGSHPGSCFIFLGNGPLSEVLGPRRKCQRVGFLCLLMSLMFHHLGLILGLCLGYWYLKQRQRGAVFFSQTEEA